MYRYYILMLLFHHETTLCIAFFVTICLFVLLDLYLTCDWCKKFKFGSTRIDSCYHCHIPRWFLWQKVKVVKIFDDLAQCPPQHKKWMITECSNLAKIKKCCLQMKVHSWKLLKVLWSTCCCQCVQHRTDSILCMSEDCIICRAYETLA